MLEAWIIEDLKRRDEEAREQPRPQLEIPRPPPGWSPPEPPKPADVPQRGVIIIDLDDATFSF